MDNEPKNPDDEVLDTDEDFLADDEEFDSEFDCAICGEEASEDDDLCRRCRAEEEREVDDDFYEDFEDDFDDFEDVDSDWTEFDLDTGEPR